MTSSPDHLAALAAAKAAIKANQEPGLSRSDLMDLLASNKMPRFYDAVILALEDMGLDSPIEQVRRLRRLINVADHYEDGPQIEVSLLSWEWQALELFVLLWCVAELRCDMPVMSMEDAHAVLRQLPERKPASAFKPKNPAWQRETLRISAEAWLRLATWAPCHMQGFLFDYPDAIERDIFPTPESQELARAIQYAVIAAIRASALQEAFAICKSHRFTAVGTS